MKILLASLILFPLLGCAKPAEQTAGSANPAPAAAAVPGDGLSLLAPEEKPNSLPNGGWFTWKFTEKPKLGAVIVKVQAYGKDGAQEKPYEVIGEFGMPSMRAHDSGPVKFQTNRKGDYLLPVNIVMVGEWELVIRVKKDKNEIYAGKVLFTL